ncbi:hypothetical protein ACH5RR_040817 [Cinchona calisaya]|uniref:Uncharacterized protein n=1 Tax=Cinchona calisaya TaxID=153742 RepID=A0ABD2XX50_9GENT
MGSSHGKLSTKSIPNRDRPTQPFYVLPPMRNGEELYWEANDGTIDETSSYIDHDEEVWDWLTRPKKNAQDD